MFATTWSKPIATKAMIGKKIAEDLAADVLGGQRHPDRQADEPVAADRAQEDLPVRLRDGLGRGDRGQPLEVSPALRSRPVPDHAGLDGQEVGDEQRAEQVADQHEREVQADAPTPIAAAASRSGTSVMLPVSSSEPAITTSTRPRVNTVPVNSVGSVPQVFGSRPERDGDRDQPAERDVGAGEERADQHPVPAAMGLLGAGLGGDLRHLQRFPCGHARLQGVVTGSMGGTATDGFSEVPGERIGAARTPGPAVRTTRATSAGGAGRSRRGSSPGSASRPVPGGSTWAAAPAPSPRPSSPAAAPAAVVGVEPSGAFLDTRAEQVPDPRARFRAGDAHALPVADAAFDVVVSGLVLNFVPDRPRRWPRCAAPPGPAARSPPTSGTTPARCS